MSENDHVFESLSDTIARAKALEAENAKLRALRDELIKICTKMIAAMPKHWCMPHDLVARLKEIKGECDE